MKVGDARMTIRMSDDLKQMTEAAATFEDRKPSDLVRIALKDYFRSQGYFDQSFITKLATKEKDTP